MTSRVRRRSPHLSIMPSVVSAPGALHNRELSRIGKVRSIGGASRTRRSMASAKRGSCCISSRWDWDSMVRSVFSLLRRRSSFVPGRAARSMRARCHRWNV